MRGKRRRTDSTRTVAIAAGSAALALAVFACAERSAPQPKPRTPAAKSASAPKVAPAPASPATARADLSAAAEERVEAPPPSASTVPAAKAPVAGESIPPGWAPPLGKDIPILPGEKRPRKIYGHYMGCFVTGTGAIQHHATTGLAAMDAPKRCREKPPLERDIASWAKKSHGGSYRDFALAPYGPKGRFRLKLEQAADLEVRRAMRIGFDGFVFDAWAGGGNAMKLFDAMMKVCEEKDYPFELSITLDSNCLRKDMPELKQYEGTQWVKAIKWLLDKHGDSPKLARRDGKILIMGYQSAWPWVNHLWGVAGKKLAGESKDAVRDEVNRLRTTPEGWKLVGEAYRKIEKEIGQGIYWEFCMSAFFHGIKGMRVDKKTVKDAARVIAQDMECVGMFMWDGPVMEMAKNVVGEGKEWSHPMKIQYENYGWYQIASPGMDWMRGDWKCADEVPSTLIQYITWNDYHESTNLSPGYNSRYAHYDLTGYHIRKWKTGVEPKPDRDRVYIFSHKYEHGTKMYPFKAKTRKDNVIEVVTILTAPAKMSMPGRGQQWDAPAGYSFHKAPLKAGRVIVELARGGRTELTLECPEPVSDRPFRQDVGKVGYSTEHDLHWKLDFPDHEKPFVYSEYGDVDADGLPNWFEMLWFGKFGDMNTAERADPDADPDGDAASNFKEYLARTDPTTPSAPALPE